jgi:hypothetical protein
LADSKGSYSLHRINVIIFTITNIFHFISFWLMILVSFYDASKRITNNIEKLQRRCQCINSFFRVHLLKYFTYFSNTFLLFSTKTVESFSDHQFGVSFSTFHYVFCFFFRLWETTAASYLLLGNPPFSTFSLSRRLFLCDFQFYFPFFALFSSLHLFSRVQGYRLRR